MDGSSGVGKFNKIDFSQFQLKGGLQRADLNGDKKLESVFDAVDKNGDKVLSDAEMQEFKAKLDANNDNSVQKKEAKSFINNSGLKAQNVDPADIQKFLNSVGEKSENIRQTVVLENNSVQITYNDGSQKIINPDDTYTMILTQDNKTLSTNYSAEGQKLSTKTSEMGKADIVETFDESGNLITRQTGKNVTEFIENGQVTKKETTIGPDMKNVESYQYDSDGNLSQVSVTKYDGSVETIEYKDGQITKKTTVKNGVTTIQEGNETTVTNKDGSTKKTILNSDGSTSVITSNANDTQNTITELNAEGHRTSQYKSSAEGSFEVNYDGSGNTLITVQNGESPAVIAKKFGCSVNDLMELNSDVAKGQGNSRYFLVGQQVKVPGEIEADDSKLQGRVSAQEAKNTYKQQEMERVANNLEGRSLKEVTVDKNYSSWTAYAKEMLQNEGVSNPTLAQINNRTNELVSLNNGISLPKAGSKITLMMTEQEVKQQALEREQKADAQARQNATKRQEADNIAQEFYSIADHSHGVDSMVKMKKLLNEKVNSDNIVEFLNSYEQRKEGDSSLVDTVMSEFCVGSAKKEVLDIVMKDLSQAARKAGVSESDIKRANDEFNNSFNRSDDAKSNYRITGMESSIDFLRGSIVAAQNNSGQIDTQTAMSQIAQGFKGVSEDATTAFNQARDEEGWTARLGDNVCGLFGCNTRADMKEMLGSNSALADKLVSAAEKNDGGAEFKAVYKQAFGVDFDPNKIAARQEYQEKYDGAIVADKTVSLCDNVLKYQNSANFTTQIKANFNVSDSEIKEAISAYKKDYPNMTDQQILVRWVKDTKVTAQESLNELSGGKTLSQMETEMDMLHKSAYGTSSLSKDIEKFNQNMVATEVVTDIVVESAATALMMAVPGGAALGAARISASAAKWGAKGVKVAKYAQKMEKAAGVVAKAQKGKSINNIKNMSNGVTKLANGAVKAVTDGSMAASATFGLKLSNGESVEDAARAALTSMEFVGAGSSVSTLAKNIMKSMNVSNAVANEIASEFFKTASNEGLSMLHGNNVSIGTDAVNILVSVTTKRLMHNQSSAVVSGVKKVENGFVKHSDEIFKAGSSAEENSEA